MGFLRGRLSRGVQLSQRVETPSVGLLPSEAVSCESDSRTSRPWSHQRVRLHNHDIISAQPRCAIISNIISFRNYRPLRPCFSVRRLPSVARECKSRMSPSHFVGTFFASENLHVFFLTVRCTLYNIRKSEMRNCLLFSTLRLFWCHSSQWRSGVTFL